MPRFKSHLPAFTVIEILIAISLASVFFSAAAMIYQVVTRNANPLGALESLNLGQATIQNFYGVSQDSIQVYSAPNYGRAAAAAMLADTFQDDFNSASAVFVLGRNSTNDYRPTEISYPAGSPTLDSPEEFRKHIVSIAPSQTTQFVSYNTVNQQDNYTIFLIQPSATKQTLNVLALYEFDTIPISGMGTYVSVRRHIGANLSAYYDILFPAGTGDPFRPNCIHFFRKGLASHLSLSDQPYAVAEEMPFYLLWWPDPSARTLESPVSPPAPTVALSHPLHTYYKMGGRTQFFFAIPAYPSLQ